MKEDFLSHVWQYQLFDKNDLQTNDNQKIVILKTGFKNHDSGPDFVNARIVIDEIEWVGQVEIHVHANDWFTHNHQNDLAYENVILHVVWEDGNDIFRKDGSKIPTLVLKDKIPRDALRKYYNLINSSAEIPCENWFPEISDITRFSMLDNALTHRLEKKRLQINAILEKNKNDWEATAYKVFARNMGFKLNSDAFARLAEVLPYKIIQKHQENAYQIEALCFGQAGFLEESKDDYAKNLYDEYIFLAQKYGIFEHRMQRIEWKFLRTRPANFPTVRIAQFAKILSEIRSCFNFFSQETDLKVITKILSKSPSQYWQKHYDFGKLSKDDLMGMGKTSIENLVINTQVNIMFSYSKAVDDQEYLNKALKLLEELPAEKNKILNIWSDLGLKVKTAFDSQALIEQYNEFCTFKKCVNCAVGANILKSNPKI